MIAIIDKLRYLFINVLIVLKDAAFEYDNNLKLTKSPLQRLIIWLLVGGFVVGVCGILLWILRSIFNPALTNITPL